MRKILRILFLMLTVASTSLYAVEDDGYIKYQLKGTITDNEGNPLPGASVMVVGTTIGAGTNSSGEFSIQLKESRTVVLRISFMGYEPVTLSATPGNPVTVNMIPAENQLNDVVVTGSRIEKPLKEVPILTRVISQTDIEALNPLNIESLLQYELPGLQIVYNSMSQLPEIKYQGVDGEYMLFLIDGERISGEGADHNVYFSRFNIDDIERIYVIKGAQSTVYGSNALGGVINIITKSAKRPFTGNINTRYAGNNGQKYSVSAGTKQNKFSSLSSITYRMKDTYTIGDKKGKAMKTVSPDGTKETITDPSSTTIYGYHIWDASQKLGYAFTDKLSGEIKGTYYHNKRDIRIGKVFQDYFIDYTLNGKLKYLIGEKQILTGSYVFDNYKKDKKYFEAGFTRTDYRNRQHIARLDYSGTFGKHTISAGGEGNWEYLKHYMLKDSANASMNTYALYLQEDWKITDQLNLIAGIRSDYHEKYHWHVTPKISMMYRPIEILTLRAGYSQGFRSPTIKELYEYYDMGGMGYFMIYGNKDLKPETSNQYSLSAETTIGGFNFSVSASHNRFKNKITLENVGDGTNDLRYINADNAKTTSLETIIRYKMPMGLILTGSYAYVDNHEEVNGKNTSSVRPHTITFNAMYSHKYGKIGANCSLNGQWASALDRYTFTNNQTYRMIHYNARTMCTLNIGATFPRGIALNVGVDNLFNYKDKASDSSLQLPQKGISFIGTLNINIADFLGI